MTEPVQNGDQRSPVLQVVSLHAGYDKLIVLSGVDLELSRGEWLALLGPNASGKTTLLHCIAGMLVPSAGSISICGRSLRQDALGAKGQLGFGCAPERLPGLLTGRQCLEVYAAAKGLGTVDAGVLELAEAFAFTAMLDRFVGSYSLGTRQKLAVLLALLGEPALVVLDEAFNGLDPASALVLKRHLRERVSAGRCGVLLATHALDVVERYSDRAVLLLDGRIARQWGREQLAALRAMPGEGLEAALAAASAPSQSQ
ncbi:MAG TPA: ABC transporter ATP-binding protein [Steroidobacteraceae bacterium]|nr:ABC transporter ATP-binding protein [Steroidobacteraceae bacterium]